MSSSRIRALAFIVMALIVAPLAAMGFFALPPFGHYPGPYGDIINTIGVPARHVTNMVTAVMYDFRGLDTLGEESILFAAVTGVVMILGGARQHAVSPEPVWVLHRRREGRSEAITGAGRCLSALALLFGIYVVLHAPVTPGGGFQGGVIIFAAFLMVYLGESYAAWDTLVATPVIDLAEATGIGIYVIAGLIPMIFGAAFLQNILPLGERGDFTAGGLIPIVNFGVGLAVAAGFSAAAVELLGQTRMPRGDGS